MQARGLLAVCALLAIDGTTVVQSKRWFAAELDCWIRQVKVPASWDDAQRRCERHGEILASPLNPQLLEYMQTRINTQNHSRAYFIGIRANRSEDSLETQFVSVEGRRLDDMPMVVFDAVDQLDLDQGDCLSMDRHGIRAVSCWDHLPYICYSNGSTECGSVQTTTVASTSTSTSTTTSTTPPPPLPPKRTSPPGYTYSSKTGSFYKNYHEREVSWNVANSTCASDGAYLVVLNDAKEVDFVTGFILAQNGRYHTWTGLRAGSRPLGVLDWRTIHGEPLSDVFHEWDNGKSRNDKDMTCARFYAGWKRLLDMPCDSLYYFTCEYTP